MYVFVVCGTFEQFENFAKEFPCYDDAIYLSKREHLWGIIPQEILIIKHYGWWEKPNELLEEITTAKRRGARVIDSVEIREPNRWKST